MSQHLTKLLSPSCSHELILCGEGGGERPLIRDSFSCCSWSVWRTSTILPRRSSPIPKSATWSFEPDHVWRQLKVLHGQHNQRHHRLPAQLPPTRRRRRSISLRSFAFCWRFASATLWQLEHSFSLMSTIRPPRSHIVSSLAMASRPGSGSRPTRLTHPRTHRI